MFTMDEINESTHLQTESMTSSTATIRPDSVQRARSLTQEIEHIKQLLSRAQAAPQSSAGSITAQVFRRRSSAQQPSVTQAQLFHELDALKKRIRHETRPNREREESASRDPDTESEAEPDNVLDEKEEEIERLKEEVELVRSQRESWIADAEARIDKALGESV